MLFRASHHSMLLEAELARRDIPFQKYGGLKFIETGHVKDLLAFLRLAENPRDVVAGARRAAAFARRRAGKGAALMAMLLQRAGISRRGPIGSRRPRAAEIWPRMVGLVQSWRSPARVCLAKSAGSANSMRRFWNRITTTPSRAFATWNNWN